MQPLVYEVIKIFGFTALSFFVALAWTPVLSYYLYKHKAWRKDGDRKVPRMGGLLVWVTVFLLVLIFSIKAWLALIVFLLGSILGLIDDLMCIRPWQHKNLRIRGLRFTWRALIVLAIGIFAGWMLYSFNAYPAHYIALVPLVMLIIFGGAPLDGLDGLFAGSVTPMFGAYAIISYSSGQLDLAIFSVLIAGALLAFLFFNIPPARFFMGETGVIGLLVTLPILAILTDTILLLPIIASPLIITALSDLVQIFCFQLTGKRVLKVAPLHHHFERLGWPHYKVTMRYWVFSAVFAVLGTAMALVI